jgi:hypothetical protein
MTVRFIPVFFGLLPGVISLIGLGLSTTAG